MRKSELDLRFNRKMNVKPNNINIQGLQEVLTEIDCLLLQKYENQ